MLRVLCLLGLSIASVGVIFAAKEKDHYHPLWASRAYTAKPFPSEWRPPTPRPTETDLTAFQKFDLRVDPLSVRAFVARFGIPQRYLVARRSTQQDMLIYNLPSGHSVALYVYKPPIDIFGAAIIVDSEGRLLRLIK
jgi:hypothetical protein